MVSYTFRERNVYVSCPRRIRFMPKTYTFHARNVYVFTAKHIRFARDTYTFHSEGVYVSFTILIKCGKLCNRMR